MFVLVTVYPCKLSSKQFSFLIEDNGMKDSGILLSLLFESNSNISLNKNHFLFLFVDHFSCYNAQAILKSYLGVYVSGFIESRTSDVRRLLVLHLTQNSHGCLSDPFFKTTPGNLFQFLLFFQLERFSCLKHFTYLKFTTVQFNSTASYIICCKS